MNDLTQDQINAILANIEVDDELIKKDTISQKLSEAGKGRPSALKGREASDEHKKKNSKAQTGRKRTQESIDKSIAGIIGKPKSDKTKQKISNALKGNLISNETREKISKSMKGRPSPTKGTIASDEHKRKNSEAQKARWAKIREAKLKEINALIASIDIDDRQINKETHRINQSIAALNRGPEQSLLTSQKLKGRVSPTKGKKLPLRGPSPFKGIITGKPAHNKGKESPLKGKILGPRNFESPLKGTKRQDPAYNKGTSKYIFQTPNGTFDNMRAVMAEFPHLGINALKNWTRDGKNGFSRTLK
jgi:NUMOD3 motif